MKKIKILYVISRLAKAGTEKHLLNLVSGLDKDKFEISVCCLFEIGYALETLNRINCKVICLQRKNIYDLRILFDLYRLIKNNKYEIVHTYLFGFHYLANIPAKIAGVPLTISSRRELAKWKKFHHRCLENIGNLFTDRVIACSNAVKEFALKTENLSLHKVVVIYNGINVDEFLPSPKNNQILQEFGLGKASKIVGMVANFSLEKNHRAMLEAIVKVKEKFPLIKCLLVGDGPLKKEIEGRVGKLELKENVFFASQRDDINQILSVMDIFVLTSLCEGLPNAILEAMGCGLAVVATNVGGVPEVVEDGRSGILVEPTNHIQVAKAVIKLLENEDLRLSLGRRGREIIENRFNFKKMVQEYEDFYGRQIEEQRRI